MARFHFPNSVNSTTKESLASYISANFKEQVYENTSTDEEGSEYCNDPSRYSFNLSEEEKKKQEFYENVQYLIRLPNGNSWTVENQSSEGQDNPNNKLILDNLTGDDVRRLIETEDELSQSRG